MTADQQALVQSAAMLVKLAKLTPHQFAALVAPEEVLSLQVAAQKLGCTTRTLWRMAGRGQVRLVGRGMLAKGIRADELAAAQKALGHRTCGRRTCGGQTTGTMKAIPPKEDAAR